MVLVALLVTAVTVVLVRDLVLVRSRPLPPPTAAAPASSLAATTSPTTSPTTSTTGPEPAGAWAGPWVVRRGRQTFVGYRVGQRFAAGGGRREGVGRTPEVSGRIVLSDTAVESAELRADLRKLSSGNQRLDEWVADRTLEVDAHPTARFELAEPVALRERPAPGSVVAVRAAGTLTVHGVAKPAVFQLEGRWTGDLLEVVGRADIRLSEWGVEAPEVAGLVRVDDKSRIELRLRLGRG